jgi:hypothetical protein
MLPHDPTRPSEPGVTALLRQLGADSSTLIRSEIALAKLEAQEMMRVAALQGVKVGAALALVAVGGLALVAWLILGLGNLIGDHYATAAAIVGILFLAVGGVLASRGLKVLRSGVLKPDATFKTLQEDKQWAAKELQEFKTDIATGSHTK